MENAWNIPRNNHLRVFFVKRLAESVVHFCLDAEAGKVFFAGIFGAGVDWAAAFLAKDVPAPVALADEIWVEDVSAAVSLAAGIFFTAFFPAGGDFDTLEDSCNSIHYR